MKDKFQKGEIVILIAANHCPRAVGKEVEVLSCRRQFKGYAGYDIDVPGFPTTTSKPWFAPEYALRKRPTDKGAREWFDENIICDNVKKEMTI